MPIDPVVLDASVLAPATVNTSISHRIVGHAISHGGLCTSEYILEETARSVVEDFGAPPADAESYIELLRSNARVVEPATVPRGACRDPHDLPIIGTAIAADAICIVSADRDLTDLGSYGDIEIVKPGTYYRRVAGL